MKRLLFLTALSLLLSAAASPVTEIKFKSLDGFGGDLGSVKSRCQTKVGAEYDPVTLTRDVNSLKTSKEFEDVTADANTVPGGVEIVFYVKRKARYMPPLVVKGCDFFSESKVAKEADLKDGFLYGEADLADAAARVRLAYQKKYYLDAKVMPKVEITNGNDATITFIVDEGERMKVREVEFEGAAHAVETTLCDRHLNPFFSIDDGQIDANELHEAVSDYPWWNPYGWFTDSVVTDDQRAQCCNKVAEIYRKYGYLDVRVTGPEMVASGDGRVDLLYNVDEGPRYKIGSSSIQGLTRYSEVDVKARSNMPVPGEVAGEQALNDAAERIKVVVGSGDLGLADTRVDVRRIPSKEDPTVLNLVFKVKEGVPVVLHDIKIRGNDYTKDNVIRREIALGPGDRMLEDRAVRSKKRLENLDYFSRVSYSLEPTNLGKDKNGAEIRDLVYEVQEKNTGSFMVGIGASSVDSVYVSAEVNQNNFDLFAPTKLFRGAGQKGRAYVAWGPRYQSAELGVVEPYFLDRMLELSVDVYRRMRWYDQFDLYRTGAMASLSYPVKFWPTWNPFGRFGVGLSGEYIQFDDVDGGYFWTDSGRRVSYKEEESENGDVFEPVIHFFWTKDARDNFRMPTSGYRTRLFLDVDPAGDNQYWRLGLTHRNYWNIWKRYHHVFMVGLRAETIDGFSDDVPIYNRMFLGGPKSIRGVEYRNVSPFVHRSRNEDGIGGAYDYSPWGGQTLFCMNFEYTIPIVKMLRFAVFSDLGSVGEDCFDLDFSDTFAWTVGVGLRLDIPMFPIRLDFGTPIEKPDHADREIFSFTVGYDF